jgi:hypothetical protein
MSKKGQGLPVSTIVIVIIAILTLTLIVLFATGTLGDLFGKAQSLTEAAATDIDAIQAQCSKLCLRAKSAGSLEEYRSGGFCQTTFEITENEDTSEKHCWEDPIFYDCTADIKGTTYSGKDCEVVEENE